MTQVHDYTQVGVSVVGNNELAESGRRYLS